MQRHPTSHPQAVLFLDIQTQGCLSFEQFGSRLKVRWIISAAKLGLAIITENDRQRAKMFSGETLALIRFLILEQPVQPGLLSQPGTRGFSNRQTKPEQRGSAAPPALQRPEQGAARAAQRAQQPRPPLPRGSVPSNRTPWTKQIVCLLWWDAKF